MKVVFVSNSLDHIQMPLCEEFYQQTNGEFYYVATTQSSKIRSKITSDNINNIKPYVIRPYESENQKELAKKVIDEADSVIWGSAPESYVINRIKSNKLTFRYMERLYKTPFTIANFPKRLISAFIHHTRYQRYNLYLLCAGAYAAYDHKIFKNYKNKRFTWGYFPVFEEVDVNDILNTKDEDSVIEIVWVGRFIKLKQPKQVIELAKYLKKKKIKFHINMIGYGELVEQYKEIIKTSKLSEIDILGSKKPEDVRMYMKKANILVFTSNREEGWGAVVNEGMNCLCAIVSSAQAGVSPYLIHDGKNGFLYDCQNQNSLNKKVEKLILDKDLRLKLAKNGYKTVQNIWNPKNAVKSFLKLSENIMLNKEINIVKEGPCSLAPVIKDGWFRDE